MIYGLVVAVRALDIKPIVKFERVTAYCLYAKRSNVVLPAILRAYLLGAAVWHVGVRGSDTVWKALCTSKFCVTHQVSKLFSKERVMIVYRRHICRVEIQGIIWLLFSIFTLFSIS